MVINNYDGLVGVLLSYLIDHRTGDRAMPSGSTSNRFKNNQLFFLGNFLTPGGICHPGQTCEQDEDEQKKQFFAWTHTVPP